MTQSPPPPKPGEFPSPEFLSVNFTHPVDAEWESAGGAPVMRRHGRKLRYTTILPKEVPAERTTDGLAQVTMEEGLSPGNRPQVGISLTGAPAKEGHAGVGRQALSLVGAPPPRSAPTERRPVVVLMDTPIARHPWLDDPGFVAEPEVWPGAGAVLRRDDGNLNDNGTLDPCAGHGTFIAGIVRQIAPDAQILSLPLMDTDGHLDEDAVLASLDWLADQVERQATVVDVVSLSFGYHKVSADNPSFADDEAHTARLRRILDRLARNGVRVVASAGNHQSSVEVFPAAFAAPDRVDADGPYTGLISVGALNPDGTQANYSNYGNWVERWDLGTAVVSTIPAAFGPADPPSQATEYRPDSLRGGFARWGGTSFASAAFAARLARALSDTNLGAAGPEAAHTRAVAALAEADRRIRQLFGRAVP